MSMLNLGKAPARPSSQGAPGGRRDLARRDDDYQSKDLRANSRDIMLQNGQTLFLGNADSASPDDSGVMLCVNGKMEPGMND